MKPIVLIILIHLMYPLYSNSQDSNKIYFDQNWEEVDKTEAHYYRKLYKNENKLWIVEDYFLESNTLQMNGVYLDKKLKKKHGEFNYYFKNGQLKSKKLFENNLKNGEFIGYYENGKINYIGSYNNDKEHLEWNWYHENGTLVSKETYYFGLLKKISQWDNSGNTIENPKLEIEPVFIGGENELQKALYQNLNYPSSAINNNEQGTVFVQFIINVDGSLTDISVKNPQYASLDAAAVKAVSLLPNWIPGKFHNLPVKVRFTLPVEFELK